MTSTCTELALVFFAKHVNGVGTCTAQTAHAVQAMNVAWRNWIAGIAAQSDMHLRCQVAAYVTLMLLTPRPVHPAPWVQRRGQCGKWNFAPHLLNMFRDCGLGSKCRCAAGSWGQEYARLHSDVLAGRAPPKYLIAEGIEGLSDSLSLVAGMLYVAILSGRALQIRETLPWSVSYDKPNIDWR